MSSNECARGHSEWIISVDGKRRCQACRRENQRRRNKQRRTKTTREGNRGPCYDTFSYTEILKARGYV